jgi:hypothetical protein
VIDFEEKSPIFVNSEQFSAKIEPCFLFRKWLGDIASYAGLECATIPIMKAPKWGNFVHYADLDLLSFGLLYVGGLTVPSYYHATQALEKYFKALALSIIDPDDNLASPFKDHPWLRKHTISIVAEQCEGKHPYYARPDIKFTLKRFEEFDQSARYPWVPQKHGNGFTSADLPLFWDLFQNLRNDIPIDVDDYMLGIAVRGRHQTGELVNTKELQPAVHALKIMFGDIRVLVRS